MEDNVTIKAQLERATSELTAKTKSQLDLIQDMNRKGDQKFEEPSSPDGPGGEDHEFVAGVVSDRVSVQCGHAADLVVAAGPVAVSHRPELQTEKGRFEEIVKLRAELEEKGVRIKSLETKLDEKSVDKLTDKHLKSLRKTLNSALVLNSIDEKPSKQVVELAKRLGSGH
ncbi:hypothetical protein Ciccas_012591 [Cichlidogyrus casuarinus]|uniref:Uncharacterized protein n=1 Tax=Cichlidogyrus casuarinus TaxID=1844966 RepID=A0ABD2PT01_9PLAT